MSDKKTENLLAACKSALRIPSTCTDFDDEISDLIAAARSSLKTGGVFPEIAEGDDSSVRVAVKVYVKANFGMDNPESEKLMRSFNDMLNRMAGASDFNRKRDADKTGGAQ